MTTPNEQFAAQQIFVTMRKKYKPLYNAVKATHQMIIAQGKSTSGHGWDHDLRVAQTAILIAETLRIGELAWVAGLMHSTDRHFGDQTKTVLRGYFALLPKNEFSKAELGIMWDAVMEHSKLNNDADNPVTVTLKDADRLANQGALNLIRGGQHRPHIPACIPEYLGRKHPESTFLDPKSCYDAAWFKLEWEEMLRLPKAKKMGKPYFDECRRFIQTCVTEMEEVGLYPFPPD